MDFALTPTLATCATNQKHIRNHATFPTYVGNLLFVLQQLPNYKYMMPNEQKN